MEHQHLAASKALHTTWTKRKTRKKIKQLQCFDSSEKCLCRIASPEHINWERINFQAWKRMIRFAFLYTHCCSVHVPVATLAQLRCGVVRNRALALLPRRRKRKLKYIYGHAIRVIFHCTHLCSSHLMCTLNSSHKPIAYVSRSLKFISIFICVLGVWHLKWCFFMTIFFMCHWIYVCQSEQLFCGPHFLDAKFGIPLRIGWGTILPWIQLNMAIRHRSALIRAHPLRHRYTSLKHRQNDNYYKSSAIIHVAIVGSNGVIRVNWKIFKFPSFATSNNYRSHFSKRAIIHIQANGMSVWTHSCIQQWTMRWFNTAKLLDEFRATSKRVRVKSEKKLNWKMKFQNMYATPFKWRNAFHLQSKMCSFIQMKISHAI